MKILGLILVMMLSFSCGKNDSRNERSPVGDFAHYDVDKDPARTSSMIKSGTFDSVVTKYIEADNSYELKVDYKLKISIAGDQAGSIVGSLESYLFTAEFIDDLRKTGHYESKKVKVDHLGYKDAKTLDGGVYKHCDWIKLYDIKTDSPTPISNLVVNALRTDGVPVLGVVKVDAEGDYTGKIHFTLGADYKKGGGK